MGGGGGSSGGAVVGGAAPWAAALAGQYQASAASAAADAAQQATNDAINNMNRMYQTARHDVQPYRTEGVQALNKLNQYLQLEPYNPGLAPDKPVFKTSTDFLDKITKKQVRNEIMMNSGQVGVGNNIGQSFQHAQYFGPGADDPTLQADYGRGWVKVPAGEQNPGGLTIAQYGTGPGAFLQDPRIQQAVRNELAQEMANNENATYDTRLSSYNQDLAEYNQNLDWYNQYKAQGPFTQEQITENISNLPGFQAQQAQGVDAIQKAASAKGYLGSGRVLKELSQFGQANLGQFYGQELDRLSNLANMGASAANTTAGLSANHGNALSQLYTNLGDTKANSLLAGGNALAQSLLAANQEYKVVGQQDSGGGGLGGLGSVLGGIGSIASAFSSREFKDKIGMPSKEAILESVKQLDVDLWRYKDIDRTHLGPYAEDFKEAFGVGDGKTINLIDMMGVLFVAVQTLSKQVEDLKRAK